MRNIIERDLGIFKVQEYVTSEIRRRKLFTIFGLAISADVFVCTGKLFGFVNVLEEKWMVRYTVFDDGCSYLDQWKPWKQTWKFVKLI